MQTNQTKLIRHFFIFVILTPFVLLWGEVFTRVLLPQNLDSIMNIYAPDLVIGYTYKPYAMSYETGREYNVPYYINSYGLRDREYTPKERGKYRILLLGDSFSVSHGLTIENSLSRQFEKALQNAADSDGLSIKIEVINAAVGGYSPYNYWKSYKRWAPIFDPDAVLVGLSPDDYDSSNAYYQYLIEDGETLATFIGSQNTQIIGSNYFRRVRKWLSWNSEFYILMRNYLYYNDIIGHLSLWFKSRGDVKQNDQLQQFMIPQPKNITDAWKVSFSYLQKLRKDTTTDGIPLIIIAVPLKLEIDNEYASQILEASGLTSQQIDFNQPLKTILDFCKKEKVTILNPRLAIQARNVEVPCYFVYDGHWVAEGIRVSSFSMSQQWKNKGLPPWHIISSKVQK